MAKGGGFLAAGDAFNYVSRMIAALVLAHALGADQYGLYNVAVSAAFVFSGVADFGLTAAMERFIAALRRRDDPNGIRGTVQVGVIAAGVGGTTIGIGVAIFADRIATSVFGDPDLTVLFQLMAVTIPILALTNVLSAVARGFKRMDHSAFAYDFVQPLVRLVLILGLAVFALDAIIASVIFGVSYLAALVALLKLLPHQFEDVPRSGPAVRYTGDLLRFSFPFWLTSLMTKVRKNIQALLLGVLNTAASVGIFSLASSANLVGRISNLAISTSIRPVIAEQFETGDMESMSRLYKTTTRWTLTLNLPVTMVLASYPVAVLGVFGESFVAGSAALVVLALSELTNAITGTCGAIIDMSGRGLMKVVNKAIAVTLLVGGNLLLIPAFGVLGAAYAVLGGTVIINLIRVVEIWWFARLQPYDRTTLKPIAAAGVAVLAGRMFDGVVPAIDGLGSLLLNACVIGLAYLLALMALRLPAEERMVLRATYRNIRNRLPRSNPS